MQRRPANRQRAASASVQRATAQRRGAGEELYQPAQRGRRAARARRRPPVTFAVRRVESVKLIDVGAAASVVVLVKICAVVPFQWVIRL